MYIMAITDETIFTEFPYLYNSIIRDEIDIYIDSDKMYLVNVLSSPYDDSIRSFAKEFIKLSIDFSSEKKKTKVDLYSEKDEYKLHSKNINVVIPAYIYSKILMYNGGSDFIIKKFSMGLSMMAENRINEWIESKSTDKWNLLDRLFEVIKKNIAMKLEWKEKHLSNMSPRVGIADFLKYSVNIGFYWNPIFFDIANGYVSIPIYEKKTGRFFREVINELIRDSFKNMKANLSDEILKNEKYKEGPFGDHNGYYSPVEKFPYLHVTSIHRRKNAIYPATIVGKPVMEDAYMGKAVEEISLPVLKILNPEIKDINLPVESVFHNLAIVSINKRYPGHAKKVAMALWGTGQLLLTKIIIVVDSDVNIHDMKEVLWASTTRMDPARDVTIIKDTPTDTLDHASPYLNMGSKMLIDATRKGPEEGFNRVWPETIEMSEEIRNLVSRRWREYGIDKN